MNTKLCMILAALLTQLGFRGFGAVTNVYSTQFEIAQSYSTNSNLIGQGGWLGSGSGGNGISASGFLGQGQSAYIGFAAPFPTNSNLIIWKPANFSPIAAGLPVVTFSALMRIEDSTNGRWDDFRWSIYNIQGDRLFSISFDNEYLDVGYLLDGTNTMVYTPNKFTNSSPYLLTVTMNFSSNRWSATLGNSIIASNKLITTAGAPLDLGDVDAVWLVNLITVTNAQNQTITTNAPGNNYMIFDNYTITAESVAVPPAQVQYLTRTGEGWSLLRVIGQNGSRWSLDATTNLVNWIALKTNIVSGTFFDHVDTTSAGQPKRFYRARLVP